MNPADPSFVPEASSGSNHLGTTLLVGCGRVGTQLGKQLVDADADVVALRRNPAGLPSSFATVAMNLVDPVPQRLPEADAMVITLTPSIKDPAGGDGYLVALQHLAAALPRVPERVVFVSSTGVFAARADDRPITEDDETAANSRRSQSLVAGEELAVELFGAHIVRPAGIYGPGREMLLRKVLEQQPVNYARRTNRIHEVDLVRVLHAMLVADAPPALVHAVDEAPARLGEVVTYIADQLDVDPPPVSQPAEATGKILSAPLLSGLVGSLQYPTFKTGYAQIIAKYRLENEA